MRPIEANTISCTETIMRNKCRTLQIENTEEMSHSSGFQTKNRESLLYIINLCFANSPGFTLEGCSYHANMHEISIRSMITLMLLIQKGFQRRNPLPLLYINKDLSYERSYFRSGSYTLCTYIAKTNKI